MERTHQLVRSKSGCRFGVSELQSVENLAGVVVVPNEAPSQHVLRKRGS